MAYNPKEDQLASGSMDGTIRLWDMETGYFRHVYWVIMARFSASPILHKGTGLFQGVPTIQSECGTQRWASVSIRSQDHIDWIYSVVFSPQGNSIASGSKDGTVRIWDGVTGTNNKTFQVDTSIRSIVYSPDGSQLTACHDRKIRTWIVETWECIRTLEGHHEEVRSTVYSPQGDKLTSGSYDNTVRVWDVGTGECQMILIGHTEPVICVAYTAKGDLIASASRDKTVRLWDVETGQSRVVIQKLSWRSLQHSLDPKTGFHVFDHWL
jgi:WD40 repeat protein